jgi:Tol biopolymer transport system component
MAIAEGDSLQDQQTIWIKSMDHDGTNISSLASINTSMMLITYWEGYPLISLCWSPDSKKILFNAPNEQDDGFHLMLVNADGSGLIQVTEKMSVNDLSVSWGR